MLVVESGLVGIIAFIAALVVHQTIAVAYIVGLFAAAMWLVVRTASRSIVGNAAFDALSGCLGSVFLAAMVGLAGLVGASSL
jgi:hypothetical protein